MARRSYRKMPARDSKGRFVRKGARRTPFYRVSKRPARRSVKRPAYRVTSASARAGKSNSTGLLIGAAVVAGLFMLLKRKAQVALAAPVEPPLISVEPAPAVTPKPSAAEQVIALAKQTMASGVKLTPEQQSKLQAALKLVG